MSLYSMYCVGHVCTYSVTNNSINMFAVNCVDRLSVTKSFVVMWALTMTCFTVFPCMFQYMEIYLDWIFCHINTDSLKLCIICVVYEDVCLINVLLKFTHFSLVWYFQYFSWVWIDKNSFFLTWAAQMTYCLIPSLSSISCVCSFRSCQWLKLLLFF